MHYLTIGIITYRNPDLLRHTLERLALITIPDGLRVDLCVVDNDADASAKPVVDEANMPFTVRYAIEAKKGRSYARNRVFDLTLDSDYLATIDDDILVERDWLVHLYATALAYGAQFVVGRLIRRLPEGAPDWTKHCRLFVPRFGETGAQIEVANSGSLLIDRRWIAEKNLRFRDDFVREDVVLSLESLRAGALIICCMESCASHAPLPLSRMNLSWVIRRSIRNGLVRTELMKRHAHFSHVLVVSLWRSMQMFYFAAGALALACVGRRPWIRSVEHSGFATGLLVGIVGSEKLRMTDE